MQNEQVKGKNVLFISPEFFAIDKNIIRVLEENGATVTWFDERSVKSSFGRAVNSICPQFFTKQSDLYYQNILDQIKATIDVVLVIKGDMISKKTMVNMRIKFPEAEFILYLYDPIRNIRGINNKLHLYDRVISFERDDCEKYGFEFRPLFCSIERDIEGTTTEPEYDICFYGTMYGDRFSVVEQMRKYCKENSIRFYHFCFLRGRFMAFFYFLTNSGFRRLGAKAISYKPKTTKEIADIVAGTKAILDVNDIHQGGLTNRTLETLISGKKLITTNFSIKDYDLYNENNVYIIDREHVAFDRVFLEKEYVRLPQSITEKYTAEGWVKDVFK